MNESLSLADLVARAKLDTWSKFRSFMEYSAIKLAATKFSDAQFREDLVTEFLKPNWHNNRPGKRLSERFDEYLRISRISRKEGMSDKDMDFYNKVYKPLESMPAEISAAIKDDLEKAEAQVKEDLFEEVGLLVKRYIFSPYSQNDKEFDCDLLF